MWSMDRYGNLFVKDSQGLNGKGYFNHSSFNAGNEVICAGMIVFNANGVLVHIDNGSGHYQPPKSALHAACVRLQSEGADFSNVRVQLHGNLGNGFIGTTFINNPDAIQDWPVARNAGLGLP